MQRRHLDGDVGNGGGTWREASAEHVEIGQSAGIQFGVDGLGELDFTGTIVSQRQEPDDSATCLLLSVTGRNASKARR